MGRALDVGFNLLLNALLIVQFGMRKKAPWATGSGNTAFRAKWSLERGVSMGSFERLWSSLEGGQQRALGQKLWLAGGGENGGKETIEAVLREELRIRFEDATVRLVDSNGRCIPLKGIKGEVVDANRDYYLVKPKINFAKIRARLMMAFGQEMKFVGVEEFESRGTALIAAVEADTQAKPLLKGTYLPICFPQLDIVDYGRTLEDIFLAAVKRCYETAFPDRKFYNYRNGELAGKVTMVEGTRHEQLIEAMKSGPVVGLWFANPLQGFSISADREQIAAFPKGYSLSGAIDIATAIVADPETLCRDGYTPAFDCAANSWQSPEYSLCFYASDDRLNFNDRNLGAHGDCSGGVLFLG